MSCDYKERNGARFGGVYNSNLMKDCGQFFPSRRTALKEAKMDFGRWMKRLSRWTVVIKRFIHRIITMICDHPIAIVWL